MDEQHEGSLYTFVTNANSVTQPPVFDPTQQQQPMDEAAYQQHQAEGQTNETIINHPESLPVPASLSIGVPRGNQTCILKCPLCGEIALTRVEKKVRIKFVGTCILGVVLCGAFAVCIPYFEWPYDHWHYCGWCDLVISKDSAC